MQSHLDDVQRKFANSNFETTTDTEVYEQTNLDLLINGDALFHANEFKKSDSTFEEFNKRNINETSSSLSREATGLLVGQGANSYKPYMMDSLFVSYYQIWDLLALHEWSNARVVINQSYERQKKMSREYEKLIEKNKKIDYEYSEIKEFINKNTNDWSAFREIMNPALMYLSGIYFLNDGDFDNAIIYLKRANGMMPENRYIQQDLELAQKRIRPTNTTWEFTDSGFAPRLYKETSNVLLMVFGNIYFTYTVPYFNDNFTKPKNSELLADVDAMFMTEYKEYRINEILRSFTSAVSKTVLQNTMYNSKSNAAPLLGMLSSVYTIASSDVDVRTWATLPKYIYVSRSENKSDKTNKLIYTRIINGNIIDNKIIPLQRRGEPRSGGEGSKTY